MDITTVVLTITTMAIIIVFGAAIASKVPITKEAKHLFMTLIINIAVPFIILNGVLNSEITEGVLRQVLIVFFVSILFNIFAVLISLLIGRMLGFQWSLAKKLALLAAIGNTGFIGIPLAAAIFGPIGGLLAAVFDAGLDVVLFSLGIYLLQSDQRFHFKQLKALINLPLAAILIGLLFAISGLQAPVLLKNLSSMLSSLAAPLAMLYIGFLLPPFFKKRGKIFFQELWYPLIMRLVFIPTISVLIIVAIPMDNFLQQLFVILTAMPTFMLATVLFSRYTNDEEKAVVTTVVSTLLSLLTIPLIAIFASFFL